MSFEHRRLRVYVAGPMTQGDTFENVAAAIRWGKRMFKDGLAPFVPQLDSFMFLGDAWDTPLEEFLEWDLEWVAQSEALFRIDGPSKGADREVQAARGLGIHVFHEAEYELLRKFAEVRMLDLRRLTGRSR